MPFKSKAQMRKFAELVKAGKMSKETYDKWLGETPSGPLPDRLGPKPPKATRKVKKI